MTLIQLQYFQSVCKYENFTRAAEEWHISQPAMSAAIKDLEKECGVALFRRDKNALSITDEGKVLLDEAGLILAQYDHLHRVVEKLSLARNYVRIGLSTLSGNLVYPEILQAFHRKYPNIQVISVEESTNRQFEMLEGGFLDAVITIRSFTDEEQQKNLMENMGTGR